MSETLRDAAERIGPEALASGNTQTNDEFADTYYCDDDKHCIILNALCDGDCRRCLVPMRRSVDFLTSQLIDTLSKLAVTVRK